MAIRWRSMSLSCLNPGLPKPRPYPRPRQQTGGRLQGEERGRPPDYWPHQPRLPAQISWFPGRSDACTLNLCSFKSLFPYLVWSIFLVSLRRLFGTLPDLVALVEPLLVVHRVLHEQIKPRCTGACWLPCVTMRCLGAWRGSAPVEEANS